MGLGSDPLAPKTVLELQSVFPIALLTCLLRVPMTNPVTPQGVAGDQDRLRCFSSVQGPTRRVDSHRQSRILQEHNNDPLGLKTVSGSQSLSPIRLIEMPKPNPAAPLGVARGQAPFCRG